MSRTVLSFTTDDGKTSQVPVTSADYIAVNRALEAEGRRPSNVSVFEYQHLLAFNAGRRAGLIEHEDFMEWAATVEDLDDADAEGEAKATPAQ